MKIPSQQKIIFFYIKVVIILIPVFIFGWLYYKDLVADGLLIAHYDFKTKSPFISVLRPQSRIGEPTQVEGETFQQIQEEPVYFDVRMPRYFETAAIQLRYKNIDQPIFELGALADKTQTIYDLKGVDNQIINFLLNDKFHWSYIVDKDIILFQKQKRFESIDDFLENLPPRQSIAAYRVSLSDDFLLPYYAAGQSEQVINKTLRGSHRMYTYIKDETLDFTFLVQDINRYPGDDHLTISIYYRGEKIDSRFVEIDDNDTDNWQMSGVKEIHIEIPQLAEGVYRIEFATPTDDIVMRQLKTKQKLLTFIDAVYLGDTVAYSDEFDSNRTAPTTLYTNGHILSAQTSHKEGLQIIRVANGRWSIPVEKTHQVFSEETDFSLKPVRVEYNDVRLATKGLISFSQSSFFNPDFHNLSDGQDFDQQKINYVIAQYSKAIPDGEWKTSEVIFDVPKLYSEDGMLHFALSLPYLDGDEKGIELSEISVELKKNPLQFSDVISKVRSIFSL